jgi:SAM-dependent methyltransferase
MSKLSYAQTPYKTFPRKECDPTRLGAIARLYGVAAMDPARARVLELGCGDGGNILGLAERYSEGSFLGVDFASEHIDRARVSSERLGLSNTEWVCADIASYAPPRAEFDYVVVHGLYSWVSDMLRERILALCKRALRPQGVALVSYNVLPGWRQRGAVRDVMQVGARLVGGLDPDERLQSGLTLLKLVASVRHEPSDPYGSYLREAVSRLDLSEPSYLVHEYLDEHNEPCLFADFAQRAASEGLQFLSEAKVALMSAEGLGADVASVMRQLSHDVVAREQVLDLCRNRMFRETILCHDDLRLERDLKASAFHSLFFRTTYRKVSAGSDKQMFRELLSGREIEAPPGEISGVLAALGDLGAFGGLAAQVREAAARSGAGEISEADLVSSLLTLWRSGFAEVVCDGAPEGFAPRQALRSAREQARGDGPVSSLRHEALALSPVERKLVAQADGSPGDEALVSAAASAGHSHEAAKSALWRLGQLGFFKS